MKIIDSVWWTNKQSMSGGGTVIGIVFIETDQGQRKAYIGTAFGHDHKSDEMNIAERGTPVYLSHAQIIINNLNKGEKC